MRIGHGYDVHRKVAGRPLILGGVRIDSDVGLLGHSDADVLLHAIADALLGAAGLGDIGRHFPDDDDTYLGADSAKLLEETVNMLSDEGYSVVNIDSTVIAQSPKLMRYIPQMQERIAEICKIGVSRVNVKATTEEGLGFTGREEGIAAHAVCLID